MKHVKVEHHHYLHLDENVAYIIGQLLNREINIMATMQDIQAHIASQSTVEDSVVALLSQVSQQLKDAQAQNDPAAVQAVIDQIDANTQKLTDAVTANTPAAPVAVVTPAQ